MNVGGAMCLGSSQTTQSLEQTLFLPGCQILEKECMQYYCVTAQEPSCNKAKG